MENWIKLVKEKMSEQKVTQEQLAERVGVSQGSIGHWLSRRRTPDIAAMNRVLQELGMGNLEVAQVLRTAEQRAVYDASVGRLSRASEHDRDLLNQSVSYYCYPCLSWAVAGLDDPSRAAYYTGSSEVSSYEASGPAYWLKVEGDAMTAPIGLSVPEGMLVLVDPGLVPQIGALVIARREELDQAIFRQLVIESGERYLKPLNPTYPKILLGEHCRLVGVVVQAVVNFD